MFFDMQFFICYIYISLQSLAKKVDKNVINKWKTVYLLTIKTYH